MIARRSCLAALLLCGALLVDSGRADDWQWLRAPGYWEKAHGGVVEKHDGVAWYRALVKVPDGWRGKPLALDLGSIDDADETFVNGVKVGQTGSFQPPQSATHAERHYTVPAEHVRFGDWNLIAVRVMDTGGVGGIFRGQMQIGCELGDVRLDGNWQWRAGDDPAWARWSVDPASPEAAKLAEAFAAGSRSALGQLKNESDYQPLPGTRPLVAHGDLASQLVDGADRFLLRKLDESVAGRARHWQRDFSSPEAYEKSIEPNRQRLAKILGVVDRRVPFAAPELVATTQQGALVGRGPNFEIYAVRWPVLEDPDPLRAGTVVFGEGLLCVPSEGKLPRGDVIALPDADQTPEQIVGLAPGLPDHVQFGRWCALRGYRVLIPTLISRELKQRGGRATLSNREYVYRSGYVLGRHLLGIEVQKVLAAVDWLDKESGSASRRIGVVGHGEGGLVSLLAGALDPRIDVVSLSGCWSDGLQVWQEPIDRNVFGLLDEFGPAELAAMVATRKLYLVGGPGPAVSLPGQGGAPARLGHVDKDRELAEFERLKTLTAGFTSGGGAWLTANIQAPAPGGARDGYPSLSTCYFCYLVRGGAKIPVQPGKDDVKPGALDTSSTQPVGPGVDAAARQQRQLAEIDRYQQQLLVESPYLRAEFMKRLHDAAATKNLGEYEKAADEYREIFRRQVIGAFDEPLLPASPRSRTWHETDKWTAYEVKLDVWPEVFAYGVLLVPKGLKPGEKRPVVVCQHGLEGRPADTILGDHPAYHDFAARLCERGFVTFAPQNLYLFTDRFRSLQRKANPLGKSLFSIIVPQHQQITDWLGTLPFVDARRIGFYGLSYGGKSAMRIPALVKNYCLSICSADFNEWVWKNASTRSPYSYVWTGEYEIFEWNLGSTFNYAEMAALVAPRPFMVERGHADGVAPDEAVGYEFAKVRHHYAARLGLADRCEIEWFVGPHTIHGQGTFAFLHRHLNWPAPNQTP